MQVRVGVTENLVVHPAKLGIGGPTVLLQLGAVAVSTSNPWAWMVFLTWLAAFFALVVATQRPHEV